LGLLFALCLAVPSAANSQPQSGSSKLESVSVNGSHRFASAQIAPATGLRPGTQVTRDDLQAAADRLAQLGLFSNVQFSFSSGPAGVKAEYKVADAELLPATFDNFIWLTDDEIASGLKAAGVPFDGNAPQSGTILDEMNSAIEKLLDQKGVHVQVAHAVVQSVAGDSQVQEFRASDVNLNVSGVEFSDALAKDNRAIALRTADLTGKPFSRRAIELFELEQVRPVYLSHGYIHVHFAPPTVRTSSSASSDQVVVMINIEPGAVYSWGGVSYNGNTVIPTNVLDALVNIRPGNPVDGQQIEAIWTRVEDEYARQGYLDIKISPVPQFDDASKRVSYKVSITEGVQYHMGNLVLSGLSLEGEKRIRGAWKIAPGAVFDKHVFDEFISTGIRGAFAGYPAHYEKIGRFLEQDAKTGKVDVLIDFQ
jgi:outer membrane protein assembly factor BamA